MKIVFPQMGMMSVAFMGALRNLGVDVVSPSRTANNALALGVPLSPETVCLPFKMTLGNFIEGLDNGADTIVMIGGRGPCRLGYYSVLQEQILRDRGYDFDIIRTDDPDSLKAILNTMKAVSNSTSLIVLLKNFYFIMYRMIILDQFQDLANRIQAYETLPGSTAKLLRTVQEELDATRSLIELFRLRKKTLREFNRIPIDTRKQPLHIGLIGEIFMVLEPFANLNIEEILGNMGVLVTRSVSLSDWFNERVHFAPWLPNITKLARSIGYPYLKENAGGESVLSVGQSINLARIGYDGIIHLMPFSCMPEMVAQTILLKIAERYSIPILHLIIDEHTGKAGLQTRIEAFVDLLLRKRKKA